MSDECQRRIGDAVFKMIVEMAYEMKYANRYCEAGRTNRFEAVPPNWNVRLELRGELPFETEEKDYEKIRLGEIVVLPHFPRNYEKWVMSRIAKVVRINKKSISLADCDQDGQLIQYNPDKYCDFETKAYDYNKIFPRLANTTVTVIKGTKHLRYYGWDS
jgi:hypothetical protein